MIAAGTLLLIAAVSLVLYNRREDSAAAERADKVMVELKQYIEENRSAEGKNVADDEPLLPEEKAGEERPAAPDEEPAVELDGTYYIGYVTIPKLGLELPVQRGWSYPALKISACRYSGTVGEGNCVICAHNYDAFFQRLNELAPGDEVIYTSLSDYRWRYEVGWTELVPGSSRDTMLAGDDKWDMTLFTCTWSGYSRVTVRCTEK